MLWGLYLNLNLQWGEIRGFNGLPCWLRNMTEATQHTGDPDSKKSACKAGDLGSIPESERCHGEGHGNPPQYSCWIIPCTEKPGRLQYMGLKELDTTK